MAIDDADSRVVLSINCNMMYSWLYFVFEHLRAQENQSLISLYVQDIEHFIDIRLQQQRVPTIFLSHIFEIIDTMVGFNCPKIIQLSARSVAKPIQMEFSRVFLCSVPDRLNGNFITDTQPIFMVARFMAFNCAMQLKRFFSATRTPLSDCAPFS